MTSRPTVTGTPSLLRTLNDRATLGLLIDHGVLSRAEICAASGLSKPTAGQCLQRLMTLGLVTQAGSRTGNVGPAAQLYQVNPSAAYGLAVDVMDDGVLARATTPQGEVVAETSLKPEGRAVAGVMAALFEELTAELPVTEATRWSMVIGVAGPYDATDDVVRHSGHLSPRIRGLDQPGVVRRVQEAVPARVSVENDVKLVALAESALGAAIEAESSVMLWAQGGVGSATVIDGRVHRGTTGSAGELDFLPVARMSGSGDQWQNGFQAWANREAVAQLGGEHGLSGSPREMIAQAVADPEAGQAFLQELAERYATGIAALVAVVDPDLVVLSGSYMFAGGDELARRIEAAVAERAMRAVPVAIGHLQDQPVLAGASKLADRQLREVLLEAVGPTA